MYFPKRQQPVTAPACIVCARLERDRPGAVKANVFIIHYYKIKIKNEKRK